MSSRVFPGGVPFSELLLSKTIPQSIPFPPPAEIVVPLEDRVGTAELLVRKGEAVAAGQRLSEGTRAAHASIQGVVAEIRSFGVHRDHRETIVVIKRDDAAQPAEAVPPLGGPDLRDTLVAAGVLAPPNGSVGPGAIGSVIVRGFGEEPVLTQDAFLIETDLERVLSGMKALAGALGARESILAISEYQSKLARSLRARLGDEARLVVLPAVFPVGNRRLLPQAIEAVERAKLAGPPFVVGANLAVAAADALAKGAPYTDKVITVGCLDTGALANMRVPLGARFGDIIRAAGCDPETVVTLIDGGLLTGLCQASTDQPVSKTTAGVFYGTRPDVYTHQVEPCIRCGQCVERCPAHLMPTLLERLAMKGQFNEDKAGFLACVECGTCAYVCPSHRELVQWIKMARHSLLGYLGAGEE